MNLQADIISGESIGGVGIGEHLSEVKQNLTRKHVDFCEFTFENFGRLYRKLNVEGGKLSIVADDTLRVVRLWCCPGYLGKYKDVYYPGMSVDQLRKRSNKIIIIHGFILVDGDFGAGFSIPEIYEGKQYDDIDYVEELPRNMILSELHVMKSEWWR